MTVEANPYQKLARGKIRPPFPKDHFHVFVLGPRLRLDEPVEKPPAEAAILEHAKYLRFLTKRELEGQGYSVDLGEAEQLLTFWQDYGANDAGTAELQHADKITGALVVYPSSFGSICELGMFAPFENISEKMLAIVHRLHENDDSFFRKALLEVFNQEKGRHVFIDYLDHDACVKAAVNFTNGQYSKLLRDYRFIELGKQKEAKFHGTAFQKGE